ncbi:hypothetical protein [Fimbriimonas ginsengisoli]|nr:hypothetical protein [Fimbriimonas ginsengisoli]
MRSLFPLVALLVLLAAVTGCSNQNDAEPPKLAEPAGKQATSVKPNAPSSPEKVNMPPVATPIASSTDDRDALDKYSQSLHTILQSHSLAVKIFRDEMRKQVTDIDKKGMKAFLGPYSRFDSSVERSVKKLEALKPPASARRVHDAILSALDRLNENLDSAVAAINEGNDQEVANLAQERNTLTDEGAKGVDEALASGGFDAEEYWRNVRLVRKSDKGK